jgi:hypothetical protein
LLYLLEIVQEYFSGLLNNGIVKPNVPFDAITIPEQRPGGGV